VSCANLFEAEIERSIEYCGLFGFKLATPRSLRGGFVGKVPYDFHIFAKGVHAALEAKQNLSGTYLQFSRVLPHQERSLMEVASRGGRAYIIVRCLDQTQAYVYAFPIHRWIEERRAAEGSGFKGIHVDRTAGGIEVPLAAYCGGYLWNLNILLS